MNRLVLLSALTLSLLSFNPVNAAVIYAGQEKAMAVCSHCHGMIKPSADAPFPSLAGRDVNYLKSALGQYRDKTRKNDVMNALAGSLTNNDISNIAAYYANLKIK
ncbi:MAG: cytochrome c [Methylococcales bacterium]